MLSYLSQLEFVSRKTSELKTIANRKTSGVNPSLFRKEVNKLPTHVHRSLNFIGLSDSEPNINKYFSEI